VNTGSAPLEFVPTLAPEEAARANFYGLLARLFQAPPDRALLEALAKGEEMTAEAGGIAAAWRELARSAAQFDPQTVREEYDSAFIGTGKAPVTLYAGAYSVRYTNEVPLAALRGELARLGLARRTETSEPEDHIAALCEVMRYLISEEKADLVVQRRFFICWIWPSAGPLCDAIGESPVTGFYRSVARFAKSFFELEKSAFEML
jgi:TorA maturation chaperone TorD